MQTFSERYLLSVLRRRFETEAQRWNSALEGGFDVVVIVKESCVLNVLNQFLEELLQTGRAPTFTYRCEGQALDSNGQPASTDVQRNEPRSRAVSRRPTLTLCQRRPSAGSAAIPFELPPLENLLPSPSAMVTLILSHAQLERYLECFDGRKMTQLRRVLEICGPSVFFDAVVQVAYLSGYRGDDTGAHQTLERLLAVSTSDREESSLEMVVDPDGALGNHISKLFDRLIQLPDPHDVLKAALAHYVFYRRKVSQAEASRILKVSRSTLQAHLSLAEHLNVAALFSEQAPTA